MANNLHRAAVLALVVAAASLVAFACGNSKTQPKVATPQVPPQVPPPAVLPAVLRASRNVEAVQIDGHRPEKFVVDRAVLRVPTAIATDPAKLAGLLKDLKLTASNPQLPFERPSTSFKKLDPNAPQLPNRQLALGPTSPVSVRLPQYAGPMSDIDALIAKEPKLAGHSVTFSSDQGKRAFGYALATHRDARASLSLEFVVDSGGLLSKTEEGGNFAGMHQDGYWAMTKLQNMWPLVFAAQRRDATLPGILVAVVDQGIKRYPVDMTWDHLAGEDDDVGKEGSIERWPWHGTHVGSIVGSAVNDRKAAAGASLLSAGSILPYEHKPPAIRVVASVMPPGVVTMPMVAQAIERVSSDVDVITASYTYWCGFWCSWFGEDDDLLKAIDHAVQRGVAVIFAAGNDSRELPNSPIWEYVVGCQRNGKALCVGAVGSDGLLTGFSNSGASVVTYAPGFDVRVSHLPSEKDPPDLVEEEKYCSFEGTSASAPFVAGVIALAESAWGQRVGNQELRSLLAQTSKVPKGGDVPIIDASKFLRQKLVFRKDSEEPNNNLSDVEGTEPKLPNPDAVYTLDSDNDTDLFPLQFPQCTSLTVDMKYVADEEEGGEPSAISLTLLDAAGKLAASGERLAAGTLKLSGAALAAKRPYYLAVSNHVAAGNAKAQPTAYDLTLASTQCAP